MLCLIFTYLDERSLRNISASCCRFFDLVRSYEKLSGRIIFKSISVLKNPECTSSSMKWEHWPALKTVEFEGHCSEIMALRIMKSIDFKKCKALENVVFNTRSYILGIKAKSFLERA